MAVCNQSAYGKEIAVPFIQDVDFSTITAGEVRQADKSQFASVSMAGESVTFQLGSVDSPVMVKFGASPDGEMGSIKSWDEVTEMPAKIKVPLTVDPIAGPATAALEEHLKKLCQRTFNLTDNEMAANYQPLVKIDKYNSAPFLTVKADTTGPKACAVCRDQPGTEGSVRDILPNVNCLAIVRLGYLYKFGRTVGATLQLEQMVVLSRGSIKRVFNMFPVASIPKPAGGSESTDDRDDAADEAAASTPQRPSKRAKVEATEA